MQFPTFFIQLSNKTNLNLTSLVLVGLCCGCVNQFNQQATMPTCSQAEAAVKEAQTEYNQFIQELAQKPEDQITINKAKVLQKMQDSEERAFDSCQNFN